jgi:hypothetical protein
VFRQSGSKTVVLLEDSDEPRLEMAAQKQLPGSETIDI